MQVNLMTTEVARFLASFISIAHIQSCFQHTTIDVITIRDLPSTARREILSHRFDPNPTMGNVTSAYDAQSSEMDRRIFNTEYSILMSDLQTRCGQYNPPPRRKSDPQNSGYISQSSTSVKGMIQSPPRMNSETRSSGQNALIKQLIAYIKRRPLFQRMAAPGMTHRHFLEYWTKFESLSATLEYQDLRKLYWDTFKAITAEMRNTLDAIKDAKVVENDHVEVFVQEG